MERFDRSRPSARGSRRPPPSSTTVAGAAPPELDDEALAAAAPAADVRIEAPALMVEASFRGVALATRLVGRDPGAAFVVGSDRGAHAPVSPAYVAGGAHALVEADEAGFVLHLTPVMRATLWTETSSIAVGPDLGRAEAPLALRATDVLRVACGDMTFDLVATAPEAPLPRPWLPPGWRQEAAYSIGVGLFMLLGLVILLSVPPDPHALSIEDFARTIRLDRALVVPPVAPPVQAPPGVAGGANADRGPTGKTGDPKGPPVVRRMTRKGTDDPKAPDAQQAIARIERHGVLGTLRALQGAAAQIFSRDDDVFGTEAANVLGNLQGTTIGYAGGSGCCGAVGTGAHGAGTGERLIGLPGLDTRGGLVPGAGRLAGTLGPRSKTIVPDFIAGTPVVHGSLDKEIIRRTIRRHVNEVRYCYEQGLTHHPGLAGRLVVQFMIAANGQVLSSVMQPQSSTMTDPGVAMCVVKAVQRWPFPAPSGGGLVQVSYPFQFQSAGS